MEIRVLGTVELVVGGRLIDCGGPKQRALLALFALASGEVVSRDRLAEALWGEDTGDVVAHRLDVQVSKLRGALRRATGNAATLDRVDRGYVLRADGLRVDAVDAERLVAEGRRSLARGAPKDARKSLSEALQMWRGPPLRELRDDAHTQATVRRLDALHLDALTARIDADLALGRHNQLLSELGRLVARHPLEERVHAQTMLALYRCGQQGEALRVYDDLRRGLSAELGIAPGEPLRRLHEAIVHEDPALARCVPAQSARAIAPAASHAGGGTARWLSAAALFAGAALATIALTAGKNRTADRPVSGGPMHAPVPQNSLGFVDLRRGRTLATVPLGPGSDDGRLAASGDRQWLLLGRGELMRIDPARRVVDSTTSLGFAPGAIAVGLGSVWVVAQDRPLVVRVDPDYGAVRRRYRLPVERGRPTLQSGLAVADGSIWVSQRDRVLRIDPRSGRTVARITAAGAASLATGQRALWVAGGDTGAVYRIDPGLNTIVDRAHLDGYVCCVATGGGFAWAMNYQVNKLSSDGRVLASIRIDGDGANLRWDDGAIWASEGISGQQTRISPLNDATRTLRTGGVALDMLARGNVATVLVGRAPPNLLAGVKGPVARIELQSDSLQPDDPALRSLTPFPLLRDQALDATCARLLTLRAASPPRGWRVVPEVADLPTSPDGRTWMFHIRNGWRFSPPSNARVTAASMRATIERALSPRMGSAAAGPPVLSDLEGLHTYRVGRTPQIRGLQARGDRLMIRLRRPARDLPLRLTARAFCAVPTDTPASAGRFFATPIASAGPYYLAAHYGGLSALMRRNPNYSGPRPGRFAAFLYEEAVQPSAAVDRVTRGRADLVASFGDALAPQSVAAHRFGSRTGARSPRWARRPLLATDLLRLRTRSGPLADARLRHAVALALDRRALAAVFGDQPTANVLPPGTAGAIATPISSPDLARARDLTAGHRVAITFRGCRAGPGCNAVAPLVRQELLRVGITTHPAGNASPADVTLVRRTIAAPDPLAFLAAVGGPRAPSPRPAPARAAALALMLDQRLTRQAAVVAFGTPTIGELTSARLSCRTPIALAYGDDLAALCPISTTRPRQRTGYQPHDTDGAR